MARTARTAHSATTPPTVAEPGGRVGPDITAQAGALPATLAQAMQTMGSMKLPPAAALAVQADYLRDAAALWNGQLVPDSAPSGLGDRRFSAESWLASPAANYTARMYLLNARTLMRMAELIEGDEKTRQRLRFAVQQWVDAVSPSNFLALNPDAMRKAVETGGESLAQGLRQLCHDVRQGHVSQTDESVFEVGRNVATTEGSVVFENAFFQLLEYRPLTAKVHERPMLFVPPCINKFYILDLQPDNSLIRHTVAEGHRVFVVSWRNADESIAQETWDRYIEDGAIRAIDVVREITGAKTVNALGFCIGGTILATALAVLAGRGQKPVESLTLLTAFLDFSDTGVLDVFIDETMVRMREATIGAQSPGGGSLLKGKELATTFSLLRPNDLVWNYVVGNYLKGETPPAFDLLYWNGDSTNLPGPMYCWYLRNTYLENNLAEPGKVVVCGQPIDLGKLDMPTYLYGSREDHIVPWEGAYRTTRLLGGPMRFVLGASGHIAGVINPPAKKKRSHWIGKGAAVPDEPQAWLDSATEQPGSWWTDWSAWLAGFGGKQIAAPKEPGNRTHRPIEPAPGRYVKQKA
jgi:polyhydroxyalkanoate synthase subunit PhaC